MTTAGKKRKQGTRTQSTDRGGAVTLPLGVLLVAWGFMLLLGISLQTASSSLNLFKSMAIGLGGGLYPAVPLAVIWFGSLLCVSAKRRVSMYAFFICFLLLLCLQALMTLLLRINDREYPDLMSYIRNLNYFRNAIAPESMWEYIAAAYNRYYGRFAGNAFFPGGGALGMLLAWPLHLALGNVGAAVTLFFLIAALILALLRLSPVRILESLSAAGKRQPGGKADAVPTGAKGQTDPGSARQEAVPETYPADGDDMIFREPQPVWPSQTYEPIPELRPAPEPGFIAQPSASMLADEPQAAFVNATAEPVMPRKIAQQAAPHYQGGNRIKETPPVQPPVMVPESKAEAKPKPQSAPLKEQPAAARQTPKESERPAVPEKEVRTPEPAADPVIPQKSTAGTREKPAIEEGIQPAVQLSGERVSVTRRTEPVNRKSLDGMAKPAEVKQIKLAIDDYEMPPVRLLTEPPESELPDTTAEDLARADKLIETLKSFSIPAYVHDITHGPTVTRFAIRLSEGVNVSRLRSVMDNLTIELKAKGEIRAEMPIPGTSFVGLEVSNDRTTKVYLRDVLSSQRMMETTSPTAVALGKDITGTPIVCELMDMPHLLIAGATGSGKSVCINSIICSMLYRASPRNVRMVMIDPKFVELQPYNDVPHLLMPVITDPKKTAAALEYICRLMDERYQILVDAGVRNLDAYNRKLGPDEDPLPRIIVIVDEMADLMTTSGKLIEDHIKRITAKARAAGICLIMATQRPSVNIITGVIKANIPGRIAFRVSSSFDSKTILDEVGAEKLLGYGDMLYRSTAREPIRIQGCFVTDKDVEQTAQYIRSRNKAEYNLDMMEYVEKADQPEYSGAEESAEGTDAEFDELLPQAIEMAVEAGQMSISMLQRVLRVGYARSGRLIDEMARRGIISGNEGTKPRKTLITREQYLSEYEQDNSAVPH